MDTRVLDLFSGPGGLGSGFSKYYDVETAIDWDKDAVKTYSHNHKDTTVYEKDVRDINFSQKDYEGIIGILGGPPCQDYSALNRFRDEKSKRANLIHEMVRAIIEIKPGFGLIENVANIPRFVKVDIEKRLKDLGYKTISKVVKGHEFGSVQIRRRWILTFSTTDYIFPKKTHVKRTASEILIPGAISEINPSQKTIDALQDPTLETGKWVALKGQIFKNYFIVDPSILLPTVANPIKLRFVSPDRKRFLSLTEMALAQGFSEDYRFFGSNTSIGQQLANAVPVELATAFARAFREKEVVGVQSQLGDYF